MVIDRSLYAFWADGDTAQTIELSPFPPVVIGGCKQRFNRLEGDKTYRYTVYSHDPVIGALILPKLILIHEGKINFMVMAPKWWLPPTIILGSQVWENEAITAKQLHIVQPAYSARRAKNG